MKKLLFCIISLAIFFAFISCEEMILGKNPEHLSWETVTASGEVKATLKKGEARVSCGPEGCSVCLKSSWDDKYGIILYPRFDYDSDSCEFREVVYDDTIRKIIGYKHELCDIRIEANLLYIEFPPCAVDEQQTLEFDVRDGNTGAFGYSRLIVSRLP